MKSVFLNYSNHEDYLEEFNLKLEKEKKVFLDIKSKLSVLNSDEELKKSIEYKSFLDEIVELLHGDLSNSFNNISMLEREYRNYLDLDILDHDLKEKSIVSYILGFEKELVDYKKQLVESFEDFQLYVSKFEELIVNLYGVRKKISVKVKEKDIEELDISF